MLSLQIVIKNFDKLYKWEKFIEYRIVIMWNIRSCILVYMYRVIKSLCAPDDTESHK
jgi:hypothetical protein